MTQKNITLNLIQLKFMNEMQICRFESFVRICIHVSWLDVVDSQSDQSWFIFKVGKDQESE